MTIAADALQRRTALLPRVEPADSPPPLGTDTNSSLDAGLFWGAVGTLNELIERQAGILEARPSWVVVTGGEAPRFAPFLRAPEVRIVEDLVLLGLEWRAHRDPVGRGER